MPQPLLLMTACGSSIPPLAAPAVPPLAAPLPPPVAAPAVPPLAAPLPPPVATPPAPAGGEVVARIGTLVTPPSIGSAEQARSERVATSETLGRSMRASRREGQKPLIQW